MAASPSSPFPPRSSHLAFQGICKSFSGIPVLKDVSFEVGRGRVLGLVGENGAGKSTLMNILGGNLQPDSGQMLFDTAQYSPRTPGDAARRGIAFIHQELNLFGNLSVAENLFLDGFPVRRLLGIPFVRRRELEQRAVESLSRVGFVGNPGQLVERLPAGERQLVEIAKALRSSVRLLILDEPTTSLSARESEILFRLLESLRAKGLTMIYISHAMGDVLRLADDIVVLRDGEVAAVGPRLDFTPERLVSHMVGRTIDQLYPERRSGLRQVPILEARNVSRAGVVREVSFSLHRGEVLGIAGLLGSGRTELARILFGADPFDDGEIWVEGKLVGSPPRSRLEPRRSIRLGLAFQTEDRRLDGLCLEGTVAEEIALVSLPRFCRGPLRLVDWPALDRAVAAIATDVRLDSRAVLSQPARLLSGGNQQKVVLAKWLLSGPRILILDEPTRGIDVGAKAEIYGLIADLARRGVGVLLISSEIEELMGLADRMLVLAFGEIRDCLDRAEFDRERILRSALGESGSA